MSKIENPQKEEVKNMMIAMILVTLIFFGFNYMKEPTQQPLENQPAMVTSGQIEKEGELVQSVIEAVQIQKAEPVTLENEYVKASFDPALGGVTDLSLLKYKETVDEDAKKVQLFSSDYFTSLMWQSKDVNLPHLNSFWALDESRSAPKEKVFVFENSDVKIERTVSLDDKYMVTVSDKIYNLKDQAIKVYQQGSFERVMKEMPPVSTVHQGFVGFLGRLCL